MIAHVLFALTWFIAGSQNNLINWTPDRKLTWDDFKASPNPNATNAAQRVFPDYSEMADAKALLESVARSFGYHYGIKKKVRINTISQSPTKTTAGSGVKGFDGFISYAEKMSPLGNATADQCADYCVSLFSDLTRMVTMQNLFHDGGFSFTGVTEPIINQMEK